MIEAWSGVLPTQSYCLVLPLDMPEPPSAGRASAGERLRQNAVEVRQRSAAKGSAAKRARLVSAKT